MDGSIGIFVLAGNMYFEINKEESMNDKCKIPGKLMILTGVALSFSTCVLEQTIKYYVSTTGDDRYKGTFKQPFATLQAAQSAIRNAKI